MTNFTKSLLLILFLAIVQIAWGQRFGMGFNSGIILSQLDGDGYTGYDKLGVRLGIRSQAFVSSRMDFIIELNYEAKGSRFEAKHAENPNRKNQYVKLGYAEIPIILRLYTKKKRKLFGEAGLAISYLINSQFEDGNNGKNLARYDEATGQFRRSELNALLGGGFALTEKLGILFRTTIGLNHLYYNSDVIDVVARLPPEQRNDPDVPLVLLRNYLVSVGIYYLL